MKVKLDSEPNTTARANLQEIPDKVRSKPRTKLLILRKDPTPEDPNHKKQIKAEWNQKGKTWKLIDGQITEYITAREFSDRITKGDDISLPTTKQQNEYTVQMYERELEEKRQARLAAKAQRKANKK